ncbi:hypothetical protein H7J93_16880 [Mycobacterium barrassiae]|uniref:hypothetical protein n=1 Tax=Mycobacterium barrassiae TaxID=319709 RepID=UPI002265E782|nr:hypothetical protein [Mycobacterium barrassiae]MCV7301296.1 hypothetical protein [Mycobacterium barrassiae]
MRFAAVVLLALSIVGLIIALFTGGPTASTPRHGVFGISGLDGAFIAWVCVGMCAIGLVLLFIDARWERRRPSQPDEEVHSAGDELFGEHDVERDLARDT